MKFTLLLFLCLLHCTGIVNAQKIFSEKEKSNTRTRQKITHADTLSNVSSEISVSQNGGDNTIMIRQSGPGNDSLFTANYTEVYENGTNKVVISTSIKADSATAKNADGNQKPRINNRATVIQHGTRNSVSISQSPIK